MAKQLTKPFLITLLLIALIALYFVFLPFITEILVAAILVSVFYRPYQALASFFGDQRQIAALLMCLILVALIIVPLTQIIIFAGQRAPQAYSQAATFFNSYNTEQIFDTPLFTSGPLANLDFLANDDVIRNFFLDMMKGASNWLMSGATLLVKETTNFIISLIMIILTMFFFFIDGEKMLKRLMYLSPLPNRYDFEIFKKFREVSYTSIISTFVTAGAQGIVGAIGFAIVGFSPLLAGVIVALLSLLPYIGSMIFYIPIGVYYLIAGQIWQGIFILAWGVVIIGNTDNVIRAYMLKGKAKVNPIFIIFSIFGGIVMFGFWGVVLGPIIIALAATILHIYELEYCQSLDKKGCGEISAALDDEKKLATNKSN